MVATLSAFISGIALLVSIVVFYENRRRSIETARLQRRPALVFSWNHEHQHWDLSNIGNGPALDVVIIQLLEDGWTLPLRMPELGVNGHGTIPRRWLEQRQVDPALAARYRSVTAERYMTRTAEDASMISEGWDDLPASLWDDIEPHWRYRRPGSVS